jgi:hypothetical protein
MASRYFVSSSTSGKRWNGLRYATPQIAARRDHELNWTRALEATTRFDEFNVGGA